jgi:putative ABC transport system permease protein
MAAQTRQIGTLKAVGVTPRQVVLVLLVENLTLAGLATAVGLAAGRVIGPRLASTSLTVFGRPETPALTWRRVAIVAGVAAAVVLLATVRPALRGLRHSTLRSLASGARPPRRPGRVARWAAAAGVPLVGVLGLRSAWRRPGRLLTNAAGLTLAVAMIVVGAGLRASLARLATQGATDAPPGEALSAGAVGDLYDQVRAIVLGTAGLLLVLATVNALIVAAFAARDSARNHATLRAVGATPRQTVATLVASQLGACVLGVALGLPLGLGLWRLMDGGDLPPVDVPATTLLAIAAAVPLAFAALVSLPALRRSRQPPAPALTYE